MPDVELVKEGDWPAVTGPASITSAKLASMAAAAALGHFDAPVKIGHFDPRFAKFDGNPALGWIENVRVAGKSLIGDLVKVPKNFAPLLLSAYRKRSIEWEEDVEGPDGRKFPAVLKAVALLGANEPAVSGLKDVQAIFAAALGIDDGSNRNVQVAFLGDDSDEIAQCLSRLSALIHAPEVKSGNDGSGTALDLGGDTVADLSDARIRELLDLSADADVEAELAKLKGVKASDTTGTGDDGQKAGETKTDGDKDDSKGDETKTGNGDGDKGTEGEGAGADALGETVAVPRAILTELQRQAALGVSAHQTLTEQSVDAEVKAAAAARKIVPAEFEVIREQLLLNPEGTRKMLAARPALLPASPIGDASAISGGNDDAVFEQWATSVFGSELATIGKEAK